MTAKRIAVIPLVLFLFFFFAAPSHSATDTVRIIRGIVFQSDGLTGTLNLEGTSGVSIDATVPSRWSSLRWANQCGTIGCPTGEVVNLGSSYGFTDADLGGLTIGVGQVTIRRETHSLWVPHGGGARAQLQFDGALVMPEVTSDTAYASAPFAFSGSVQIPSEKEPGTVDVFDLRGHGVATALLSRDRFNAGSWHVSAVTYEFAARVIPQ